MEGTCIFPAIILYILMQSCPSTSDTNFIVTGAREARVGTSYSFSIFVSGEKHTTSHVTATMSKQRRYSFEDSIGAPVIEREFLYTHGKTNFLKFEIPDDLEAGRHYLTFVSEAFNTSHDHIEVNVVRKVQSVFIQTDKSKYKPGQVVKFRTIAVDADLKPYKGDINITIFDSASNRIKELTNKKNDFGVISDNLKLSVQTPLGSWKIVATTKLQTKEKTFEIAEYVLPKFEVKLVAPKFFFLNTNNPRLQEPLIISATAQYTFGQPVNGIAAIKVQMESVQGVGRVLDPAEVTYIHLVNGRANLELEYDKLLRQHPRMFSYRDKEITFKVDVDVTETLTSELRSDSGKIVFKNDRLKLEFLPNTPDNFKSGLRYYAFLGLTKIDSSPVPVNELRTADGSLKNLTISVKDDDEHSTLHYLPTDENGFLFLNISTPQDKDEFEIEAAFFDNVSNKEVVAEINVEKFVTKYKGGIQLSLENTEQVIKPNVNLRFKVNTVEETERVTLQVLAKGTLVEVRESDLNEPAQEHTFILQVSSELALQLAPEANFVAFYVSDGKELIADSLTLNVDDYMANKISLTFSKDKAEPGEKDVVLKVKTQGDSYVGLLGVDQSVLLLSQGNDLTLDMVQKELASYSSEESQGGGRGFVMSCWPRSPRWSNEKNTQDILKSSGLKVLTNIFMQSTYSSYVDYPYNYRFRYPGNNRRNYAGIEMHVSRMYSAPGRNFILSNQRAPGPSSPRVVEKVTVRKKFPETFIWSDVHTDSNGDYHLTVTVPDTITSWVTTAFSMNSQLGLGVSESPAKLTVVKPFFISLNLPSSIIRGEEFALQVTVFNYLLQDLQTEVKLSESGDFKVIDCDSKLAVQQDVSKTVHVERSGAAAVYFWVRATTLGQVSIQVTARAGVAADAMKAQLLVKPEGRPDSYSVSSLIHLPITGEFHKDFEVEVPDSDLLVAGSVKPTFTIIGDVIGSSMDGIEDLLHMPSGCGEQNLVHLAPDVFLLKYLSHTSQLKPDFEKKALQFINSGYQRQLTYQRSDGSFSAFGNRDAAGSVWLSAFTIKCFHQARDFIPIEDNKIVRTLNWIIDNQDASGQFSEPRGGRVYDTKMQGGASSGFALTAYTLISFLENKDNSVVQASRLQDSISKAVSYLERNLHEYESEPYTLAIISYAFSKAGSARLDDVLRVLNRFATEEDGMIYWSHSTETVSEGRSKLHRRPKSYSIELASYVLMVHMHKRDLTSALPVAKWLLSQRNGHGGFSSTQDTVLGLEALSSFGALFSASFGEDGVRVTVTSNPSGVQAPFQVIRRENSLNLQTFHCPPDTTSLSVHASGKGVALAQLSVQYNIHQDLSNQQLSLHLNSSKNGNNIVLAISTSWNGSEVSGMVLVEVNVLTGYKLVNEDDTKQMIGRYCKRMESSQNKIVFYLDELTSRGVNIRVYLHEALAVANVKPALVKVYRYYDTHDVVSAFYSAQGGQTWQGACPLCCPNE